MFVCTEHFDNGDKIEIEIMGKEYTYNSRLLQIFNNGILHIMTPVCQGHYINFPKGTEMIIVIKKEVKYTFYAKVISIKNINTLVVKISSDVNQSERKNNVRLKTFLDVYYREIYNSSELIYGELLPGIVLDLSAGGLLLHSNKLLKKESIIEIFIEINDIDMILFGRIVKIFLLNKSLKQYNYSIEFIKITTNEQKELRKFLFKQQMQKPSIS